MTGYDPSNSGMNFNFWPDRPVITKRRVRPRLEMTQEEARVALASDVARRQAALSAQEAAGAPQLRDDASGRWIRSRPLRQSLSRFLAMLSRKVRPR